MAWKKTIEYGKVQVVDAYHRMAYLQIDRVRNRANFVMESYADKDDAHDDNIPPMKREKYHILPSHFDEYLAIEVIDKAKTNPISQLYKYAKDHVPEYEGAISDED